MGTNSKNKPYSKLGKLLDSLARSRDVRGPYNIARYIESATGHDVSGQAVSKYRSSRPKEMDPSTLSTGLL